MNYFFSPSTRGFYVTEIHGDGMPGDVVELTEAEHAALIDGQSAGGQIEAGALGRPILRDPVSAPPAPVVPDVVTMRQARLALLAAGKLDAVDAVMAGSPRPVQITWDTAGTVERTNPLIEALAPQLGLSDADLDNLFIEAAKL